jgi:hypothetical protein
MRVNSANCSSVLHARQALWQTLVVLLFCSPLQVHNMLDTLTFSGCLQRLKETAFASSGAKPSKKGSASQQQSQAQQQDDEDADDDEPPAAAPARSSATSASAADLELSLCLCYETLTNLAAMAQQVQLRGSQEVLQAGLEGCSDLLCCSKTAKVPAGSKGLGLSAGVANHMYAQFSYAATVPIFQHPDVREQPADALQIFLVTCRCACRCASMCSALDTCSTARWILLTAAVLAVLLQAASALLRIRCWRAYSAHGTVAWRIWHQWCCQG